MAAVAIASNKASPFLSQRLFGEEFLVASSHPFFALRTCFGRKTMLSSLSQWFWNERLWFPAGLGWADLQDRDGRIYPKGSDLWVTLPIALVFLIIRQIFERTVALRLASVMGVKEKVRVRADPNPTLESFFCTSSKHPGQSVVESLSKQTGFSQQQVQRWFRRRRNQERPNQLKKFREASWRFTFYLLAFLLVWLFSLTDVEWLPNIGSLAFSVLVLYDRTGFLPFTPLQRGVRCETKRLQGADCSPCCHHSLDQFLLV
ncbi:hypothetical protein HF521_015647 [Silurus meridionalis]|uniref:Homeobox domain-containing protein n=1 Tax=Silurus meridionalis TaxID=175797 RepID=A0A8T0A3H3_SILME|nr:hypothetical protein HF521_015647 [Silurus meridionalis]